MCLPRLPRGRGLTAHYFFTFECVLFGNFERVPCFYEPCIKYASRTPHTPVLLLSHC